MNYLYCKKHPNQILWATENGPACCACTHDTHPLSAVLRDSPPTGHYLGTPEVIAAMEDARKNPQCDDCGIFSKTFTHECKGSDWKEFHTAVYYTCDDSADTLSHESWEEAIEDHLDGWYDPSPPPNKPIDEVIQIVAPLTVYAYKRKVLPASFGFGESAVDSMLESFEEDYWCEEYGCPFEEGNPPWDKEKLEIVKTKLYATMQECVEMAHIWQCDVVAEKAFDEEELTALLKEHSPHWWEERKDNDND